uniref:Uncharacterized protein n=1 Tax=Bionectria ochroleuca TaxID=29856 RepID=A0A8H7NMF0_BIOOC
MDGRVPPFTIHLHGARLGPMENSSTRMQTRQYGMALPWDPCDADDRGSTAVVASWTRRVHASLPLCMLSPVVKGSLFVLAQQRCALNYWATATSCSKVYGGLTRWLVMAPTRRGFCHSQVPLGKVLSAEGVHTVGYFCQWLAVFHGFDSFTESLPLAAIHALTYPVHEQVQMFRGRKHPAIYSVGQQNLEVCGWQGGLRLACLSVYSAALVTGLPPQVESTHTTPGSEIHHSALLIVASPSQNECP